MTKTPQSSDPSCCGERLSLRTHPDVGSSLFVLARACKKCLHTKEATDISVPIIYLSKASEAIDEIALTASGSRTGHAVPGCQWNLANVSDGH